jgi:hypothetical protein
MTKFLDDKFSSRPSNDAYREGWDAIDWSKKAPNAADTLDELPNDEYSFENQLRAAIVKDGVSSAQRAPLLPQKPRCNRVHDSWHPCVLDPGHDGPCNSTGVAEPAHINEIERDILREGKETNHLMRGDSPFKSVAVRNYGPQPDRFNSYLMESEGLGWKGYSEFRCTSHAVIRRRVSYPVSTQDTQVTLPEWEEGPWEALSPSEIITYGSSSRWRAWVNERSR